MTITKDLTTLSFPKDRFGRTAATHVIMQYPTPQQWALAHPAAAEQRRQKAELYFGRHPDPLSSRSAPDQPTSLTPGRSFEQQRQDLRQRVTVWYCCRYGCPYNGPYAINLYANCIHGCGHIKCATCSTQTTLRIDTPVGTGAYK